MAFDEFVIIWVGLVSFIFLIAWELVSSKYIFNR